MNNSYGLWRRLELPAAAPRVTIESETGRLIMTSNTGAAQAAMIRKETLINTVATAVIAAALSWAIFRGQPAIALAPPVGGILGILPGTFNFTLLVTIALTLITRRRVRAAVGPPLARADLKGLRGALPSNVLARALTLAGLATLVFVPVCVGGVWLATRLSALPLQWSFAGLLGFYVVYFVVLSMVVTPIVLWRALAD